MFASHLYYVCLDWVLVQFLLKITRHTCTMTNLRDVSRERSRGRDAESKMKLVNYSSYTCTLMPRALTLHHNRLGCQSYLTMHIYVPTYPMYVCIDILLSFGASLVQLCKKNYKFLHTSYICTYTVHVHIFECI